MEFKEIDGKKVKVKRIKVKLLEMHEEELFINTDFIKLDSALKFSGVADTGGYAKILIEKENIRVNSEVCTIRGKKLYPGDKFEYKDTVYTVVSQKK